MWYLYDKSYTIISKLKTEPEQDNKAFYDGDLDLDMFTVIIGNIQEVDGVPTIIYLSKRVRSDFELANKVVEQNKKIEEQGSQIEELTMTLDFIMADVIPSLMG